jgi:hypothetical protein
MKGQIFWYHIHYIWSLHILEGTMNTYLELKRSKMEETAPKIENVFL